MTMRPLQHLSAAGLTCLLLSACGGSSNGGNPAPQPEPPQPVPYTYEVTVTNLTMAQPLSPIAVALHEDATMWQIGEAASEALELMAESGDNSELLADEDLLETTSGEAPLGAGESETLSITVNDHEENFLTVSTMLVNTNDAFTGVTGLALADLAVDESISMMLPVYDAGTEANSETAATVPGPAGGGEGFNAERDDADTISYHPGVVTADDMLTDSALSAMHRFDNPAIKITITRVE